MKLITLPVDDMLISFELASNLKPKLLFNFYAQMTSIECGFKQIREKLESWKKKYSLIQKWMIWSFSIEIWVFIHFVQFKSYFILFNFYLPLIDLSIFSEPFSLFDLFWKFDFLSQPLLLKKLKYSTVPNLVFVKHFRSNLILLTTYKVFAECHFCIL